MENNLRVGFYVRVVNEEGGHFGKVGKIVRIAKAIDIFYVVEFKEGDYAYFKEEDLEIFVVEEIEEPEEEQEVEEQEQEDEE